MNLRYDMDCGDPRIHIETKDENTEKIYCINLSCHATNVLHEYLCELFNTKQHNSYQKPYPTVDIDVDY